MYKILVLITTFLLLPINAFSQIAVFNSIADIKQAALNSETVQQGIAIKKQLDTMRETYDTALDTYENTIDTVEEWNEYVDRANEIRKDTSLLYDEMDDVGRYLDKADRYTDKSRRKRMGEIVDEDYRERGLANIQEGRQIQQRRLQQELRDSLINSKQVLASIEKDNDDLIMLAKKHKDAESLAEKQTVANEIALKNLEMQNKIQTMMAHQNMAESRAEYTGKKEYDSTEKDIQDHLQKGSYKHWKLSNKEKSFADKHFK